MAVTRGFETPGKPWAGVIWRRCTVCRATTVQHLPRVASIDGPPTSGPFARLTGHGPASFTVTELNGVITIQATGKATLRITGVNELMVAVWNVVEIYRAGGDLTVAMSELDSTRQTLCGYLEGRQ